jgi:hypothetical protein
MNSRVLPFAILFVLSALGLRCEKRVEPFCVSTIDRTTAGESKYPVAADPAKVGTFAGLVKSGAGYFYDDVLEYRVWLHPEKGAPRLAGDKDYFAAFGRYETALRFTASNKGAETPLVLVRQRESINEPSPGVFQWEKRERLTEWQVAWLVGSHRDRESIPRFLAEHGTKSR